MGDVFKEQLVKRNPTAKDALIKAGLIIAAFFVVFVSFLLIPGFLPVAVAVSAFGLFYAFSMMSREYEYIFTSGELDIDCIYGKSRRKRKFSCDMKDVVMMTHHSNGGSDHELSTAKETLNLGTGANGPDTFFILAPFKNNRVKVIFDPNEKMVQAMQHYLGARKLRKQGM